MQRNIELIRYRRFGADLLMLDLLAATSVKGVPAVVVGLPGAESAGGSSGKYKTISNVMQDLDADMMDRFEALRAYLTAPGDDVQETTLRFYVAFKRIKNFACVEFRPTTAKILVFVKIDPASLALEPGGLPDRHSTCGGFWSMIDLAEMVDTAQPKPNKRGPYRKVRTGAI